MFVYEVNGSGFESSCSHLYYPFNKFKCHITITPRIPFRNPQTLKDHLVRSKLDIHDSNDEGNEIYKCGNINCDISNALHLSKEFQSTVQEKGFT